ncbi:hypothetical protein FQN54_008383 [Arachnomyces sp. PD_36]|nr:hypothetical protein FQN54_008383 [Arachnomyces sp. PD_36]
MSGVEILGLIGAILTIVEASTKAYDAIKDLKELPEAFEEVHKRLPIVQSTLKVIQHEIETQKSTSESDLESSPKILDLLKSCENGLKRLQNIFTEIKESGHRSPRRFYRKLVLKLDKAHSVESIMGAILNDLQLLVTDRVFKTATKTQVEELEKAIQELVEAQRSIPDFPTNNVGPMYFNEGQGGLNVQNGHGDMNNVYGSQYNGHNISFGGPPPFEQRS